MKKTRGKLVIAIVLVAMLMTTQISQLSAISIGGGTSTGVSAIQHNYDIKYVDTSGVEIDTSLNYTDTSKGKGSSIIVDVKDINGYEFKGYYYENVLHTNDAGSSSQLLTTIPPIVQTLSDGNDTTSGKSYYTVYMVYDTTSSPISYYSITYLANEGNGEVKDSNSYIENSKAKILEGNSLSRENYTFKNWNTMANGSGTSYNASDEIIMNQNITLYAQWEEKKNALYQIEHYHQQADGTYKKIETEVLQGITNTIVEANIKIYEGFTCDKTIAGTVASGTISKDGSLVLKLYYNKNALTKTVKQTNSPKPKQASTVSTGDTMSVVSYMGLLGVTLTTVLLITSKKRKISDK
ncbi:MAG: InlB B-repeat-containing protein [Coprobacillaceae bacterium]